MTFSFVLFEHACNRKNVSYVIINDKKVRKERIDSFNESRSKSFRALAPA